MSSSHDFARDVCVIGGAGHVGLPLALTLADCGWRTVIYDVNERAVDAIRRGVMPFREEGGTQTLARVLDSGRLEFDSTPRLVSTCKFLVMVIGTPIDEHLNPNFTAIHRAIDLCAEHLRDGQVLILRSTVFPGISQHIRRHLREKHRVDVEVAFCPERVAEGYSLKEFRQLPQIVSAFAPAALEQVKGLFRPFTSEFVKMEPTEAELCKLMTNAWRYLQFAAVNQFYMIATERGLNFDRILHGCRHNYPRMAGMPGPGFAAGPCLAKDTMQLAAFSHNSFVLGHAAMLINEGLPAHVVSLAQRQLGRDLSASTCGILGMAFKADSDDPRDSLSFKLWKLLKLESVRALASDPYVKHPDFVPTEQLIDESDVIFIGAPHTEYRGLVIPSNKLVIDVWSCVAQACAAPPDEPDEGAGAPPPASRAEPRARAT